MKKGLSQVDWAISLSIFLLYIAWFFLIIKPQFEPEKNMNTLLINLREKFEENNAWEIEKIPIFIKSNQTNSNMPVIIDFPLEWTANNFGFVNERYFSLRDNRLFFLHNFTKKDDIVWLAHSSEEYDMPEFFSDLTSTSDFTSTYDFKADYSNNLLYRVYYRDNYRINSIDYYINGLFLEPVEKEYDSDLVIADYKVITQALNHTSYVFASNSIIQNYIDLNNNENEYVFGIIANLGRKYISYYSNNKYGGLIDYNLTDCIDYRADLISFYTGATSISFIMPVNTSFSYCINGYSQVILNMSFSLDDLTEYKVVLHPGGSDSIDEYKNSNDVGLGTIERINGINNDSLVNIETSSYNDIKNQWNFPKSKDFGIILWNDNNDVLFNYTPLSPSLLTNVYVKEWDTWILEKDGKQRKTKVNLKVW